jgi:hypothetical protein
MTTNKLARELDTRELVERPKQWQQPELLPEPDKQPGYAYRWIRVASLNNPDPRNLSAKLREGWEPVRIEEQPKLQLLADPNSRFKDNIEIGGLLLCKTPEEFVDQRNKYYSDQASAQMKAVENTLMRQNDPRMPLFNEEKTTIGSFGKGS